MQEIPLPGPEMMISGVSEAGGELVFIGATDDANLFEIVVFRNPESEQPVVEILDESVPGDEVKQAMAELHVSVEEWTEDDIDEDLFDFDFDDE